VRLLLAQAPFRDTFGYSMPPPGLLRLGGELLRRGIPVELEDLAFRQARGELANGSLLCESAARRLLRRGEHEVIGLSVMGATLPAALEITRRLRELRPGARLLLGGPGTTGVEERVLERFPWIDAVVRGEAEATLPELLEHLESGAELTGVAGVSWRDEAGRPRREPDRAPMADLGQLAPYAWELLPPLADYKAISGESEGLVPLDSGRGCVYDCSFCTIGRFWSRRSRCLPAPRLVEEVHALTGIEGARNAYLCHDIFGADRDQAVEFCEGLLARGVRPWECRARVDHLDAELVELMGRAGCYRVLLGVESAAPEVRRRANKGQRDELDVLAVVERLGRAGIRPILSLILGLPGEGEAELEASLALVARAALVTDVVISLHLPNPQPGCGLKEEIGSQARPVEGIPPDMAFGCGETAPERALIEAHPDLFSTWALPPGEPAELRALARLAEGFPELIARWPRSWEVLRRLRGATHRALFEELEAEGLSLPELAAREGDELLDDVLAWEEAVLSLDGARTSAPTAPEAGELVASRARLVESRHDLLDVARRLAAGEELERRASPTLVALTPVAGGVRSDRVAADVGRVLALVDPPRPRAELEARHPGIGPALDALGRAGLITPTAAPRTSTSRSTAETP